MSEFGSRSAPKSFAQRRLESLLTNTGVTFNGNQPWDIQVLDPQLFSTLLLNGSLSLGEGYMNGSWECAQIDEFMNRLLRSPIAQNHAFLSHALSWLSAKVFNLQNQRRAFQVGEHHYDIGNDLYRAMLDPNMVYSCGYWADSDTLADAQKAKLDLICRKLELRPGMTVLDIGCGWGSFAQYAAEQYGVEVVGVTVSKEQAEWAENVCRNLPVEIRLQDYRQVEQQFDAVVSVGMFEHVGHKNYRTFIQVVDRCLKPSALCLLHTIGKNHSRKGLDPWTAKYIFPNGEIPSMRRVSAAVESRLVVGDWDNFGPDYDKTLMAWFQNFDSAWDQLKHNYSDAFYRMWKYYLLCCAGAFRARRLQLWQIVLSKGLSDQAYRRPA
jgi:cyclopropane-fatty-acyl-phospholipid synthase